MTYIDPSKAIIAKMIAFDKECVYTHLVSPPPLRGEHEWVAEEPAPTRWQKLRLYLRDYLPWC